MSLVVIIVKGGGNGGRIQRNCSMDGNVQWGMRGSPGRDIVKVKRLQGYIDEKARVFIMHREE